MINLGEEICLTLNYFSKAPKNIFRYLCYH